MLVYGDHKERADPRERFERMRSELSKIRRMQGGIERHARLIACLIHAGKLLQGLADAEFAHECEDRRSSNADLLGRFVYDLARSACGSWDSGFRAIEQLPTVPQLDQMPRVVELRTPEGFACYAVYPEAYIGAARRLALVAPPRVIGIRSIGTTLAAIVAAALDAPPPLTVRPYGDPFARQIAIAPQLGHELLADDPHFAIVDEGPGLSGSSFGAVADWLQERGVPLGRIAFVPSHSDAPGAQASDAHRQRWAAAQRAPALFDELPHLLGEWVSSLVGEIDQPLADISAGEWRKWRYPDEAQWPAVNPTWERRKFLASAGGAHFLVKFAGLGAIGERKLEMAHALHSAGFVPEPIGLAHGFLVERWCGDARPLEGGDKPISRLAHYIAARAQLFPSEISRGATIAELFEMCWRNVSLALGDDLAGLLDQWGLRLEQLSRRVVRVRTDNRLLPHEWFCSSGHQLKTDALDHHAGHDLIGCQDVAWDVAGAIVEFELDSREAAELIEAVERSSGRDLDCELLDFYRLAYLAFRLGQAALSADGWSSHPDERLRLEREAIRYRGQLEQLLLQSTNGDSAHFLGRLIGGTNRAGNKPLYLSVEEEEPQCSSTNIDQEQ